MPKSLFAVITKADESTRTVSGIAMQEVVDLTNECCDYLKSKPYFLAWSANQEKASGGKSKGNVREMHTPSAVGKVTELVCNDSEKAFEITAHIVDDAAWKKVEEGVYTGFSIGANFAEKSVVKEGVMWWVADPVEVSLVDLPCVPTATFDLKKADGTVEKRKFSDSVATKVAPEKKKSIYTVAQMASTLGDIFYMANDLDWEAQYENDGSEIPARLRTWLTEGATIFLDMSEEETSEFAAVVTAQKSARAAGRQKKGAGCGCDCAGCSKCTKKAVQPTTEKNDMTPAQEKAFNDGVEAMKASTTALTAATEKFTAVAADVASVKTTVETFDGRLTEVEKGTKAFGEFLEVFGEEPAAAKTKSAAAVAVPREAEKSGEVAELPKDGDNLTDKPEARKSALKTIYANGPAER